MKILVVGGTGLIGGHAALYLKQHGHDVTIAGRKPAAAGSALAQLRQVQGDYVAGSIADRLPRNARVLVLGLTFKENVPDLRNSKVIDVITGLKARGLTVDVHDALADPAEASHEYDVTLMDSLDGASGYDAVVGAVSHDAYAGFDDGDFTRLLKSGGLVADVKGMWRKTALPAGLERWSL